MWTLLVLHAALTFHKEKSGNIYFYDSEQQNDTGDEYEQIGSDYCRIRYLNSCNAIKTEINMYKYTRQMQFLFIYKIGHKKKEILK